MIKRINQNLTNYPINTSLYIIGFPKDMSNLEVPIILNYNKIFNWVIMCNLEQSELEIKLNNIFQNVSVLDFYDYLHKCKNLLEFEKYITINENNKIYYLDTHLFLISFNKTINFIYKKFYYQIHKGIK